MKKTIIASIIAISSITGFAQTVPEVPYKKPSEFRMAVLNIIGTCKTAIQCEEKLTKIKHDLALYEKYYDFCVKEKTCEDDSVELAIMFVKNRIPSITAYIERQKEWERLEKLPDVRIGMSQQTVLNKTNWGRPDSINRTTTANGTREQWVYARGNYLYFTNGILTAIQN